MGWQGIRLEMVDPYDDTEWGRTLTEKLEIEKLHCKANASVHMATGNCNFFFGRNDPHRGAEVLIKRRMRIQQKASQALDRKFIMQRISSSTISTMNIPDILIHETSMKICTYNTNNS